MPRLLRLGRHPQHDLALQGLHELATQLPHDRRLSDLRPKPEHRHRRRLPTLPQTSDHAARTPGPPRRHRLEPGRATAVLRQHVRREKRPCEPMRCQPSAQPVIRPVRHEQLVLFPMGPGSGRPRPRELSTTTGPSPGPDTRRTNPSACRAAQLEPEADGGHLHRNTHPARTARHPGTTINASDVAQLRRIGLPVWTVMEILTQAGLLAEDRTPALDTWFNTQISGLPPHITTELADLVPHHEGRLHHPTAPTATIRNHHPPAPAVGPADHAHLGHQRPSNPARNHQNRHPRCPARIRKPAIDNRARTQIDIPRS